MVSCSCSEKNLALIREFLQNHPNVLEFRTIIDQSLNKLLPPEEQATRLQPVDHLALFHDKMAEIFGYDEIAMSEIERILA